MIFDRIGPKYANRNIDEIIAAANETIEIHEYEHGLGTGASNCSRANRPPKFIGPWGCIHDSEGLVVALSGKWGPDLKIDTKEPFGVANFPYEEGRAYDRAVRFINRHLSVIDMTVHMDLYNVEATLLKCWLDDGRAFVTSRIVWTNRFNRVLDGLPMARKVA